MNPKLTQLQPYPFEKLRQLQAGCTPPKHLKHIPLSIGEPKHPAPDFVLRRLSECLNEIDAYPATIGIAELREAIAAWLINRFQLPENSLDAEQHVLPVSGTREALFSFTQAIVDSSTSATVCMPNPFYQIYEGAALLAGATPHFLNCTAENNFEPDFNAVPASTWQQCQLLFICSPGNPTGAVLSEATLIQLIKLADQYDFVIASDECYSEIYADEAKPPVGLLQACANSGRTDYRRCVVFHSLSKRSNLPGLRSGFVAGDASIIKQYLRYRTYHGCTMPVPVQKASIAAWRDESHVAQNRALYREKFSAVFDILKNHLDVSLPEASFYLWPTTPIDDEQFSRELFSQQNVTVLPGRYLARPTANGNPGEHHVRMALVAPLNECIDAATRIRDFIESLS